MVMEDELNSRPRTGLVLVAPCFLALISRVTIYLGFALVAIFFLHGVASRLSNPDTREPTMLINFGRDWRNIMRGAVVTNVV